ncbi:MAG: tetratricopeptide repeat protein [Pseudomonadota bacterium]|nr:tetratricopeptide repeat protein [Pseudomonadota bacterium]
MLGIALAASTALSTAAVAQREGGYRAPSTPQVPQGKEQQQQQKASKGGATIMIGDRKVSLTPEFTKAYQDLLSSIEANETAAISGKVAAAHAAAKTPEEHYLAYQLQLKAGMAAKNEAEMGTAVAGMIGSGVAPQAQLPTLHLALGKVRYNQKQFPQAIAEFEKVLQLDPGNTEAANLIAQSRMVGATPAEAVAMLQKTIAEQSTGGKKAPEELYKRALSAAYKAKLPAAVDLSREWVAAYPTPTNWSDAIRIYRNFHDLDDAATLDLLRLARAAGALNGEADYDRYAYAALTKGYQGEAKSVLDEGIKAGIVNPNKSPFKEEIAQAKTKSAGEEASLDSSAKSALAGGTAKAALATGDLHYTYGQYAKAAELYRAALKRPGADANLINLHLGMALARSGDKAGATAALSAVTGPRADIAKYWLAYVSTLS